MMPAETRKPILDIGGVADLARLAVADDIDTGRKLTCHDFIHTGAHGGIETGDVERLTRFLLLQPPDHIRAARQAAHMRRRYAIGGRGHGGGHSCPAGWRAQAGATAL